VNESDGWRTEAAIEGIEGQRLMLYKWAAGGPSLFEQKAGEPALKPPPEADDGPESLGPRPGQPSRGEPP
jgi:hypothetical protein